MAPEEDGQNVPVEHQRTASWLGGINDPDILRVRQRLINTTVYVRNQRRDAGRPFSLYLNFYPVLSRLGLELSHGS